MAPGCFDWTGLVSYGANVNAARAPSHAMGGAWMRIAASVLALTLIAAPTGCRSRPATSRVLVLGLDGLEPTIVDLLMAEGKLPHFARLRQDGAYAPLQSARPLLSPVTSACAVASSSIKKW